jgi:hypothetical protein
MKMGDPTFDEWFSEQEFWHENSRQEDFKKLWDHLVGLGVRTLFIAQIFDEAIAAMRDEYGD